MINDNSTLDYNVLNMNIKVITIYFDIILLSNIKYQSLFAFYMSKYTVNTLKFLIII